jgi:two-component system, NarL family, nitrate/nitrite response regulator NarL
MHPSRDREAPMRIASDDAAERCDAPRGEGPGNEVPRALIVSDVRLYREALEWRLAQSGRVMVVGTTDHATAAITLAAALSPDVVIVDRAMPDAMTIARVVNANGRAKVVAFAIADVDNAVIECAEAGLAGYVTRDGTVDDLIDSVERAARGEVLCSPRAAATLFKRLATLSAEAVAVPVALSDARIGARPAREADLTRREYEIAVLIERGLSNKEIARELAIGTATVKNHVHNILEKLEVSRRGEAAATMRDGRAANSIDSRTSPSRAPGL